MASAGWLVNRRSFLGATGGLALAARASMVRAGEPPTAAGPRATAGDDRAQPVWDEWLTITVGSPAGGGNRVANKADMIGGDHRVIQAAVNQVAHFGGGTVRLLAGTWKLTNAVYLVSGVRIAGSGDDTILIKNPSVTTKLAADSDWYDQEITLADAKGFQLGDGVCLRTRNPHNGGTDVVKRTLIARQGNRFKLDRALRENFWRAGESTASTLFPIFSGEEIADVTIENLLLDGNREQNENLDGNYAGCVFLQDSNRITLRGLTARNYNGDGISWQICHDVLVENCHSHGHAGLGLHPGSGSQRPVMRGNRLHDNDIGIFFCWGVKHGLAEHNVVERNRIGVSIGHRDTDNLIADNQILESGLAGVLFRPERGKDFAPHRNRLQRNRIVDSGPDDGIGVDVQGQTESITIADNEIRETRKPMGRIGVRVGPETRDVTLAGNRIEGFAKAVERWKEEGARRKE